MRKLCLDKMDAGRWLGLLYINRDIRAELFKESPLLTNLTCILALTMSSGLDDRCSLLARNSAIILLTILCHRVGV